MRFSSELTHILHVIDILKHLFHTLFVLKDSDFIFSLFCLKFHNFQFFFTIILLCTLKSKTVFNIAVKFNFSVYVVIFYV